MGERGRLRAVVMIAVFDVGGPLIMYVLLRNVAGLSAVLALVLSGILPAVGVAITAVQSRRTDLFGVMVLIGILFGSVLGLTTHNPRLYLAEGSVPSLAFSIACLASLRMRQPLIYRIALEFLGTDTKKGREITDAWRYQTFQRAFRTITIVWGAGYIIEAALRLVVAETTSTGIALICSKVAPYVFATVLAVWTLVYGERRKKVAMQPSGSAEALPLPRREDGPFSRSYGLLQNRLVRARAGLVFETLSWWLRGIARLSEISRSCCRRTCGNGSRNSTRSGC